MNKLQQGNEIEYGGYDWIILDIIDGKAFVLAKESICQVTFDEDGCNNFAEAFLMRYLNGPFVEELKSNGANIDALCDFMIDLTADDGLKDYGDVPVKVGFRTCDQHRKYRYLIPDLDIIEWTATLYSTDTNGYPSYVSYVHTNGVLSGYSASNGDFNVRPTICLDIAILESENIENPLYMYSNEELLQELARRMEGHQ